MDPTNRVVQVADEAPLPSDETGRLLDLVHRDDFKVIHATHGRSSRLGEEARLLSQLRHPCICSIFGTVSIELPSADGTMGSRAAIVLEKLNGGTLAALIHKPTSSIAVRSSGWLSLFSVVKETCLR